MGALALHRDQIAALQGADGLWTVPQLAELLRVGEERVRELVARQGVTNRAIGRYAMYRYGDVLEALARDSAPAAPAPRATDLPRERLGARRGTKQRS